ncbi:MAG TPA: VOC family protein [Gemmatimonadales bacterium]|nr:VOC family protein [Gemmatimonadales bacterium]
MLENIAPTPMLAVKDIRRARRFYEETLGFKPDPTGLAEVAQYRASGSTFVVYQSEYAGTNRATALTWVVGDELEKTVAALKAKGVRFETYDLPGTERQGDVHVSGEFRNAWFKDPDGNIHALASQ